MGESPSISHHQSAFIDLRLAFAAATGKAAGAISRYLGRGGGTALPGLVARQLDGGLVRKLASQIPRGSILVTGTNGKTTTSRMLAVILHQFGLTPLHNRSGSNLMRGMATVLLENAQPDGRLASNPSLLGLFEVDEAVLPYAIKETCPKVVVITNLFRDQLDRYGEVDSVAARWRHGLRTLMPGSSVVLNSDDPLVASVGQETTASVTYFGIEDMACGGLQMEHAADSKWCPRCEQDLRYERSYYGHIGHYSCAHCGWTRPDPQIKATRLQLKGFSGTIMRVSTPDGETEINLRLPGIYNVYNALAAASACLALGVPLETVKTGLEAFTAAFGRTEQVKFGDKALYLVLVKNPIGLNEVLRALLTEPHPKNILFVLNDGTADGKDVSWIWDVDFEMLQGHTKSIVVSGWRAEDMALRLKCAGILHAGDFVIERDLEAALRAGLDRTATGETLYVLSTYTAMLEMRELLTKKGLLSHFWEEQNDGSRQSG